MLLNNPEEAYNLLNDEYKEIRFENIEIFKKYIEESKEKIESAALSGYLVKRDTDITKYVLKDSYEDYYILDEDCIMNFKAKLDSYTIPEGNFEEEYAKLKESEKTSANIGIFIQMINSKDYKHAYEKLSEGFKDNYFKTQEDFENYIKNNWYNALGYDIKDYDNEGNIYIYDIALKNLNSREVTTMDKKINIRLNKNNDTDFEISFNVE